MNILHFWLRIFPSFGIFWALMDFAAVGANSKSENSEARFKTRCFQNKSTEFGENHIRM